MKHVIYYNINYFSTYLTGLIIMQLKKRVWDSNFFKKPIYDIDSNGKNNLDTLKENLNTNGLVTSKIKSQDLNKINELSSLGYSYCEGELDFIKQIQPIESTKLPDTNITPATPLDLPELNEIISNLYEYSRFKSPWFSQKERARFYTEWLKKAVHGTFDDICYLLKDKINQSILGFITLKVNANSGQIGLIGVSELARGKGVASQLLNHASNYFSSKGCHCFTVATQTSNLPAINLYIKNNFQVKSSSVWFYKGIKHH